MRKPLQPKPVSRNPDVRELRLQTHKNGYPIVRCEGKVRMDQHWSTTVVDEALIRQWDRPGGGYRPLEGTGIRLDGDLLVLDLDVSDQVQYDKIRAAIDARWPGLLAQALERTSGGVKRAFLLRTDKPFRQARTRRYTADKKLLKQLLKAMTPDERRAVKKQLNGQLVEVFGGLTHGRYFAWAGPHSPGREYLPIDPGRAPWNVPRSELPVFPADEIGQLIDLCDAVLVEDLTVIPESEPKPAGVQWDLEPDDLYISQAGEPYTMAELIDRLDRGAEQGMRGCLGWNAWSMSDSHANCNAFIGPNGQLIIQAFQDDVQHRMKADQPAAPVELDQATIDVLDALQANASMFAKAAPVSESEISEDDEPAAAPGIDDIVRGSDEKTAHDNALAWLLTHMAWCDKAYSGRNGVISIDADGEYDTPVTVVTLRARMASYCHETTGPKGGIHRHNPVEAWMVHPRRVVVAGIRMRPELPAPLFKEGKLYYVNRYAKPRHPPGGSTADFDVFMERLVPDEVERAWLINYLALKVQQPHRRMIAVAMVARDTGTGRGLLGQVLARLFGERFVASVPYAKISGGAGSRFNAELMDKLIVCINESRDADDRKFAHKNAAREALKDFIEPSHAGGFRVEPKGHDAFFTRSALSTFIFTNHLDGLPIAENDRRVAVLTNGPQMTPGEVEAIVAWMERPENVGALYRRLERHQVERDKAVFNAYMAPRFYATELMIEAGKTALDLAWEQATAKLRDASDLYTMSQVVALTRHYAKNSHGLDFDDLVRKHTGNNGYRIGKKHSTNWLVTFNGERERVYAHDAASARRCTPMDRRDVLKQLYDAQKAVDAPHKAVNKLLRGVVKDE